MKIGDEVLNSFSYSSYIYEGEFLIIQFFENKYFELDKVFLEDDDISDQVENGFLKMKLTSYYNSHITINYKPKKYTLLLTDIQHIEQISKRLGIFTSSKEYTNRCRFRTSPMDSCK